MGRLGRLAAFARNLYIGGSNKGLSLKKTHRPLTTVAVLLSLFMAAVEMTVVATAMPTVAGELGGIHLYAWVFTTYLLTSTVTVPIFGKLADLFGRKPVLMAGLGLFFIGSLGCGLSSSMQALIVFRAFQGLGAGALQPTTLTVIGDIYELRERARVQGMTGAVWGMSGLLGPLLGGYLVEWLSWQWIFLFNLPFLVLAALLFHFCFHEDVKKTRPSLDLAGAATLSAAILCLLSAADGAHFGRWPMLPALLLLVAFVEIERRAKEPVLPLELFRTGVIGYSSVASAFFGAAMLVLATYVPLYVQSVLGGTSTEAGRAVTPMVLGWPIFSAISGKVVPKIGFRPPVRVGFGVMLLSITGLAVFAGEGSLLLIQFFMFFIGAGMGFASTALILSVQTAVSWEQRGVATASTMFFRTIGGTLAVGLVGGIVTGNLGADAAELARLGAEGLSPALLSSLRSGLLLSFWIAVGLAAATFAVGVVFPKDRDLQPGGLGAEAAGAGIRSVPGSTHPRKPEP